MSDVVALVAASVTTKSAKDVQVPVVRTAKAAFERLVEAVPNLA